MATKTVTTVLSQLPFFWFLPRYLTMLTMKSIALDDNSLNWFKSYTNRQQKTSINDTLSSSLSVSVSVPQGSILGPLLFIIYINDMPSIVKHCKVILYADDTLLYYSSNSAREIEKYVNEDLHLICRWLKENLLTLNCAKSKFILFGSSKRLKAFTNISIHVNDHELAREETF